MKTLFFSMSAFIRKNLALSRQSPRFRYLGIDIEVNEGVVNPSLVSISRIFAKWASKEVPKGCKTALEMGTGSGLTSLLLAKKGLQVTATDIDEKAVQNTLENASRNKLDLKVIQSDWDAEIKDIQFDYVVSNPPYLPSTGDLKFSAGPHLEIFQACLAAVAQRLNPSGKAFILSSSWSNRSRVQELFHEAGLKIEKTRKRFLGNEWIYGDVCCLA